MRIQQKIITSVLSAFLVCPLTAVPVVAEDQDFDTFLNECFVSMMEEDYLTVHYSLKNPEAYGVTVPEPSLGEISWDDYAEDEEKARKMLDDLHTYDRESLSDEMKNEYDSLEAELERQVMLNMYPYFDFAFYASGGVLDAIQTNLSEFQFYQESDFEDYLEVVADVDDYLDDCMELTEKQAEAGYFLSEGQLNETLDAIDAFLEKTDDNALIISFNDAVDAYEGLDEAGAQSLKDRNAQLIGEEVIPAYQKVSSFLQNLSGSRNGGDAVCDLENGKEYYASLAVTKTGKNADVQSLLDTCNDFINRAMQDYLAVIQKDDYSYMYEEIEMESAEEILDYLKDQMKDLPEMPQVQWKVSYLDPSIASDSINAYYVIPPVDDRSSNVMKINGDNVSDTNSMYETLAHEGFPGHLYQNVTYYENADHIMRYMTSPIGYTEGWAMYAEMLAWSWSPLSDDANTFFALSTAINYVLDAAVDLGVNGLGWSIEDVEKYLDQQGFNSSIAEALYEFVTLQPGVILPYGYGLAEMMNLRYEAQDVLKDDFKAEDYHEVILKGGARPFEKVEADVHTWLYGTDAPAPVKEKNVISPVMMAVLGGVAILAVVMIVVMINRRRKKKHGA